MNVSPFEIAEGSLPWYGSLSYRLLTQKYPSKGTLRAMAMKSASPSFLVLTSLIRAASFGGSRILRIVSLHKLVFLMVNNDDFVMTSSKAFTKFNAFWCSDTYFE